MERPCSSYSFDCQPVFQVREEAQQQEENWLKPGFYTGGHSCDFVEGTNKEQGDGGRLLLFGGYNGRERTNELVIIDDICAFAEEEKEISFKKVNVEQINGRAGHASFLWNHKLCIYGGYDSQHNVLSDFQTIDLSSDEENFQTESVSYTNVVDDLDRRWHCSYRKDNLLFVHAGWNDRGPLNDVLTFNLETQKWQQTRFSGTSSSSSFGKRTKKRQQTHEALDHPSPRRWHTMIPLEENPSSLFVFGGYDGDPNGLNDAYFFHLERMSWTRMGACKGPAPSPRCRHSMLRIGHKQGLLIGGFSNYITHKDMFFFHSDDHSWSSPSKKVLGQLHPVLRSGATASLLPNGHTIVICGGFIPDYVHPIYTLDIRRL
ncbi:hypothetical protein QOT17_014462 [Balamuthia mandrillaris]